SLAAEGDLDRGEAVEPTRQIRRIRARARQEVDLGRAIRSRDDDLAGDVLEPLFQPRDPLDRRLAVIREEHDRIALEELVGPARSLEERADRRVALLEGALGRLAVRAGSVRREVVRGEVIREEVEAVAGDEPPSDGGGVGVDRALTAAAHRERRAR